MSRRNRTQVSRRTRLSAYLESLETRQMLSATALAPAVHASVPNAQPAGLVVQPAGISLNNPAVTTATTAYTPLQIRMAYGVSSIPNLGQGTTVAIVDAYADPTITSDISLFSTDFGLPQMDGVGGDPTFSIQTPTGQPAPAAPTKGTWDVEESLDVEYVHSIAPYANIDLVEAATPSGDQLFAAEVDGQAYESAVYYAKNLPGVDVISNSYGGSEFNGETDYDTEFSQPAGHNAVAFTFSTGDSAAPGSYPAYAPDVVAVGGTSLYTASARGIYGSETAWSKTVTRGKASGGGGGVSLYETTPSYQSSNGVNFGARATPDVSMDANPNTGVLVIDSYDNATSFLLVGGTSLASPMWAGVIDLADATSLAGGGNTLSTTTVQNTLYGTYNSANYGTDFHDVTTGNNGFAAGTGYDLATGIGSPKANALVPVLAAAGGAAPAATTPNGGAGSGVGIHITGAATTPIATSIPTQSTIAAPSVQNAMPSIATANVTMASLTVTPANAVASPTAAVTNSSPTPTPVNDTITADGSHGTLLTTTEFASNLVANGVGADGAGLGTADPSADGTLDAAVPAALSGNLSDVVFADASASIFDRMAEAPAAIATPTEDSHTAEIAMLAGAALALYGYRSAFARSEEKVGTVPVLA